MRRFLLAAVMFGAASGAQAADMPFLRGSFTEGLSTTRVFWQGYYVGGQATYGSSDSKLPAGINGDMQATFTSPGAVLQLAAVGAGAQPSMSAMGHSRDTTRNGKTSSSASRRIISMAEFALSPARRATPILPT